MHRIYIWHLFEHATSFVTWNAPTLKGINRFTFSSNVMSLVSDCAHARVVKLLLCAYYYYYYYYFIYLNILLLLLLRHIFKLPITITITRILRKPITITITSQTITITMSITFPLLLHLLLLLNQRNTTQADYKVIFKDIYCFYCITHYHRHITTDTIIIKLSWKFCGIILK